MPEYVLSRTAGKLGEKCALVLSANYFYHTSQGSLTCSTILLHEADGFTCPPKEVVLQVFIALKNLPPSAALNPRTVGPVASTITTRPPKATI
jgi:hypothetical protein